MIAELALTALLLHKPTEQQPPEGCRDRTALMLWHAGFRGETNRIAWSITWRESKHQNLDESSPWYTGALGIWQVQTSAHSPKPWWSRAAMLNPTRQSKIVYRYMSDRGRNWQPWGLNRAGTGLDTTQYGGWSTWQHQNWIWAPYAHARTIYPNRCAR